MLLPADDAGCANAAFFLIPSVAAEEELQTETRWRRNLDASGRTRPRERLDEELVCQRIRLGEERAQYRGWQGVDLMVAKLGVRNVDVKRQHRAGMKAVLMQQLEQARTGEESQMSRIEQADRPVPELARHEARDDPRVTDIGHRDEDASFRLEQGVELSEDAAWTAQVLEDVGTDDRVVGPGLEMLVELRRFEIQDDELAIGRAGPIGRRRVHLDAVHHTTLALAQRATQRTRRRSEIEHAASRQNQSCDSGERIVAGEIDDAVVTERLIQGHPRLPASGTATPARKPWKP